MRSPVALALMIAALASCSEHRDASVSKKDGGLSPHVIGMPTSRERSQLAFVYACRHRNETSSMSAAERAAAMSRETASMARDMAAVAREAAACMKTR